MAQVTDLSRYYFAPGDFSYMRDKFQERYLAIDYKVIEKFNAWELIKNDNLKGDLLDEIRFECWGDHTNETFMKSMKEMKYLAEVGWDNYANSLCPYLW